MKEARHEQRREELRDFLRSRRARLPPGEVGLPTGERRRTPGLRREEVAALAGIGLTWYTWLEQGRRISVTTAVLDAVGRALRLDAAERAHLYRLAGHVPGEPPAQRDVTPESVVRVVDEWLPNPAYVLDRHWRFLYGNRAVHTVFGDVRATESCLDGFLPADGPFHHMRDWEAMAPSLVAEFRADAARYPGDMEFARIVARLSRRSEAFAGLWARQEVKDTALGTKRVEHPSAGYLRFDRTTFRVVDHPDLRITLLLPRPGTDTRDRLGGS
ncbi:helix-turn-helix domain-containing protein [Streptomyces sp. AV19]|uniref:helix-turn-helix transcriptional regulator n=1 Tax=Streptomyces sp. AV19 TaxID=2793068 RepID=UPI0018FE07D8|nr:helix-turn-helix transcriptional regulator [Streptomyces sp. AV19]MBH1933288.1 helix-turn-helix domain-containing protein [Streptomyces sp. AV19]MDG4536179.1 helix-turn-helix transcriptional regulator [Streptomyces sp. AV19]